uniref:F-box domain-containing protein n=1 Tax=Mycena chlorophos TaxID=658473 RepID=A0ABQ0L8S0_MYCCL|nr:predicted protein [Mycena chlorophos]
MMKSKTPLLPEELLHEILTYLDDADLLALATLSTHIHALVLTLHLRRHRVSPADLAAGVIPLGTLGIMGTLHSLRMGARAGIPVPRVDVINVHLHFSLDDRTQIDESIVRQVIALSKLPQQLPGIKHISMRFTPYRLPTPALASIDTEGLLYSLLLERITRPVVVISPLSCSIVRPRRPRRALGFFRAKKVQEGDFRSALYVLAVLRGAASCIPAIDVHVAPQESPVGGIVLIRNSTIERMSILGNSLDARFTARELSALFSEASLPSLKLFRIEDIRVGRGVEENALMGFLSRHPQLVEVSIRAKSGNLKPRQTDYLPTPHLLPNLERLTCDIELAMRLIQPREAARELTALTVEIHTPTAATCGLRDLLGLFSSPTSNGPGPRKITALGLVLFSVFPWNTSILENSSSASQRTDPPITQLDITFRKRVSTSDIPPQKVIRWLQSSPWTRVAEIRFHLPAQQTIESGFLRQFVLTMRGKAPGLNVKLYQASK